MKVLYFDTETTGIDPLKNDIVQLSGMIEIDGKIVEQFNMRCQPFNYENIDAKALEVTGNTIDGFKQEQTPKEMYKKFIQILSKHVDKFNKKDKMYVAGYNVRFDMEFLRCFFVKNGDGYFGSWFNWRVIDALPFMHVLDFVGYCSLSDYKLGTVCNDFGIEIDAHDAFSDIKATHELIQRIRKGMSFVTKSGMIHFRSTDEYLMPA